ncbi:methyltransferase, partial [Burkholderia pseudomallei]|nr:methyltransferase [Burkholderia pseudomallei]
MSTVIEARPPVREGGEIEAQVNYLAKGVARPVA